jgi:hypothetical protein
MVERGLRLMVGAAGLAVVALIEAEEDVALVVAHAGGIVGGWSRQKP